jgi:hydrogenase expression/formation protein HypD
VVEVLDVDFLRRIKILESVFRGNLELAKALVMKVNELTVEVTKIYGRDFRFKIMDFCGTHEWTITHYGIRSLLPEAIEMVAGPGCPVCVTPSYFIEELIKLSLEGLTIYTYGDVYRLRTIRPVKGATSLAEAKAFGGKVKIVTSILDAIRDAREHGGESIFVGIGFETIAPGYAYSILKGMLPSNLKLLNLVKLTPPAMFYSIDILREKPTEPPIMGVIAPGHVSTITGAKAWAPVAENYGIPVVVAGFEPIDVLVAVVEILRQLSRGEARVTIEYARTISWHGDLKAQSMIHKAFETVDDAWRGIGFLPKSGLRVRESYRTIDAFREYSIRDLDPGTWR